MNETIGAAQGELFDVTARKVHQWGVIVLSAIAFIVDGAAGGWIMLGTGLLMIAGRFWDQVDLIRLFYHLVLKPRGVLRARLVAEDRATRRIARVLGGAIQIVAGGLVLAATGVSVAWALVGAIAVMIALDATVDFCVLCFVVHQARRAAAPA
jgi:hypothetical protein